MKRISSVRRWSKIVSLVLCSVVLLVLLGGCAEKESNSSQETVTSETETSLTDNPATAEQPSPTDNLAATEQPAPTEEASLPAETSPTEELIMMLRIDNKPVAR